jgi:hypothetical protein
MRQRLVLAARSILAGWVTLLPMVYLVDHPLLILIAGKIEASWIPTVRLMLDCLVLAGTGWVTGRLGRPNSVLAVTAFAATLALWDFGDLVEIQFPWLLHLAADALRDARYLDSFVNTAVIQIFLFGSLIAGGILSRRAPETAPSILGGIPK